MKNSTV